MSDGLTQAHLSFTVSTPLGSDTLLLCSLHGEERLSSVFHFTLEMLSADANLDPTAVVGQPVTVSLGLSDGTTRYLNGVVGRFVQAGSEGPWTTYYAEMYPWLWLLTMTADCRIFQNQTVPQILETVFTDLGFTAYRNALTATYAAREYCVQYNESAFAFVSRLMEDEGIFYFFEHTDTAHTLVLADDVSAFAPCAGLPQGQARLASAALGRDDDAITACTLEHQVTSTQYSMDDFNFTTPATDLLVNAGQTSSTRKLYEYPGGFGKTADGETRAGRRLQVHEFPGSLFCGESYCRAFSAGATFQLTNHARADANQTYALYRVVHSMTQQSYANTFEAFLSTVPFRPARVTPRPVVAGMQTALVVGKSGEEIWTDQYGRVIVQFHWDQRGQRNENSSCWLRVAQGWAGKQWGSMFIPRIDQEVLVSFLEGDPDRPIITGVVYNAQQTVPYALPTEQTKSTIKSNSSKGGGGSNEIRFEDKKDAEELFIHAQKDMTTRVEHVLMEAVKSSRQAFVMAGDATLDEQVQEALTVEGSRKVTIKGADKAETHTNEGTFSHTVAKTFELTVNGDSLNITAAGAITIKGKSITLQTTGGDLQLTSAANLSAEASRALTNTAGTSLTNKANQSLTNDGGMSLTNKASSTQEVDGGTLLTMKGAIVKIN